MEITFDPSKRDETFKARGLAFEDAQFIFEGRTVDMVDSRNNYQEERIIRVGMIEGRMWWSGHNAVMHAALSQ